MAGLNYTAHCGGTDQLHGPKWCSFTHMKNGADLQPSSLAQPFILRFFLADHANLGVTSETLI